MPSLTAVAVCLWMKTADTDNKGTQLSYAVPGTNNELTLWKYKKLGLSVGGRTRYNVYFFNCSEKFILDEMNASRWSIGLKLIPLIATHHMLRSS